MKMESPNPDWKTKLLLALAEPEVHERRDPAGCLSFIIAMSKFFAWVVLGFVLSALAIGLPSDIRDPSVRIPLQVLLFLSAFFLWFRWILPIMARHVMRGVLWRLGGSPRVRIAKAKRPPVLYLRSFRFDHRASEIPLWMRLTGFTLSMSREMIMTMHVSPRAPLLAIGKPDESEAPPGAARFYVGHDHWQAKVQEIVPLCSLVLWATGRTRGLQWEMRHLVEHLPPEKLVLWLHVHVGRWTPQERREEWQAFRKDYESIFPKPLPEDVEAVKFITFQPDWTPVCLPMPGASLWSLINNLGMTGFRELMAQKLP